jgi:hypothetical protein
MNHVRVLHGTGLGFPAALSHVTCTTTGDLRIVDFGDSVEHHCNPETCEELKKLIRLLNDVEPRPP